MMTIICATGRIHSDTAGLTLAAGRGGGGTVARSFIVAESLGTISYDEDDRTLTDTSLLWLNRTDQVQDVTAVVARSARTIRAPLGVDIRIEEGVSWEVGDAPTAPTPGQNRGGLGTARLHLNYFVQGQIGTNQVPVTDDAGSYLERIGPVEPGKAVHFRHRTVLRTPTEWDGGGAVTVDGGSALVVLRTLPIEGA